jgi:ubiquinone biosynthesis protein UbiJ
MAVGKKTGGRKKGTPNKTTTAIKEMVIDALDKAGGVNYLLTQAADNPTAFLTLVGKVLPLQVQGDPDHPLIHEIRRRVVRP